MTEALLSRALHPASRTVSPLMRVNRSLVMRKETNVEGKIDGILRIFFSRLNREAIQRTEKTRRVYIHSSGHIHPAIQNMEQTQRHTAGLRDLFVCYHV